jgi:protoheme IX farnesyltransferase
MPRQIEIQAKPAAAQSILPWRDYLELCKPRVVALMLLCATVGMFLASTTSVPLDLLIFTNLGIALVAGSAACVNHLVDAGVDAQMTRTARRPIAQGRVSNSSAIVFRRSLAHPVSRF